MKLITFVCRPTFKYVSTTLPTCKRVAASALQLDQIYLTSDFIVCNSLHTVHS